MSFVIVAPEALMSVASEVAGIGSALNAANAAAAAPTTGVLAAAADEVSAAMAALFGAHAQEYQRLSAQAAGFHAQFVQALNAGVNSYASAEAANASPLQAVEQQVLGLINGPAQTLLGRPLIGNGADGAPGTGQPGGPGGLLWGNGGNGGSGVAGVGGPGGSGARRAVRARRQWAGRFEGSRDDRPLLGYDTPTGLTCPYTTPLDVTADIIEARRHVPAKHQVSPSAPDSLKVQARVGWNRRQLSAVGGRGQQLFANAPGHIPSTSHRRGTGDINRKIDESLAGAARPQANANYGATSDPPLTHQPKPGSPTQVGPRSPSPPGLRGLVKQLPEVHQSSLHLDTVASLPSSRPSPHHTPLALRSRSGHFSPDEIRNRRSRKRSQSHMPPRTPPRGRCLRAPESARLGRRSAAHRHSIARNARAIPFVV